MKGTLGSMVIVTLVLGVVGTARSQSGSTSGQASGQVEATRPPTSISATTGITAGADAKASAETIESIKSRGAKATGKTLARMEARLDAAAQKVNQWAARNENDVATRLATEFGSSVQAMSDEKVRYQREWGELMLAHTLSANSKQNVTVDQVFELRGSLTWSQIAKGMGYHVGEAVEAARAEARVAVGTTQADGSVATIHGEGAKAGVATTATAKAGAGNAKVGAGAGVQTGVSVETPPVKLK